jgi:hypothetical protein
MPLPPPTTQSPGKIVVLYTQNSNPHRAGVNYVHDVVLSQATCQTDADNLATVLKQFLGDDCDLTSWEATDYAGNVLLTGALTAPGVGTNSSSGNDWNSATCTFTGKGIPATVGIKASATRLMLFTGATYGPTSGLKSRPISGAGTPPVVLAGFLLDSTRLWADRYGQKATLHGYYTVQFNAHAQKRIGS